MEEASYLMDRPPGGWSDLVTNQTLGLRFEVSDARMKGLEQRLDGIESQITAFESRLDGRFDAFRHELVAEMERRFRVQAWSLVSAIFAAVGLLGVLQRI